MRVKASHRVALALILCYLVAWLDRMAINMTIPFMAKDLGIGPERIGWILSAFFLGYSLFQIPGGILADRHGPRKVILGALSWWSVFTALTGLMGGLPSMLATRFLFGVGEGVFPASVWKVLAQWYTKKDRTTANAVVISSIALGPALTPLLLAPVLARYGWRVCFYLLGLLGVVCVLVARAAVYNAIRESPHSTWKDIEEYESDIRSEEANAEGSLEPAGLGELLRMPAVWVLFFIALVFNVTMYGWLTWLPSYLMKVKGLDLRGTAWAASLPFAFGTVGCISAGWISDRFFRGRRKRLVLGCMVLGGLSLWGFTRVADPTAYMALQCVAGLLLFMACGACGAFTMILLPTRMMGAGSGFINTGGQIGGFLTNLIIGYTIAFRGGDYAAGFDVMLGALVLAALLVLLGIREGRRGTVAAAAPLTPSPSPGGEGEGTPSAPESA
jgi:sugar phosphate permease